MTFFTIQNQKSVTIFLRHSHNTNELNTFFTMSWASIGSLGQKRSTRPSPLLLLVLSKLFSRIKTYDSTDNLSLNCC